MLAEIRSERGFLKAPPGVMQYLAYGFLTFLLFWEAFKSFVLLKGSCNNCVPVRVAFLVLAGLTCRAGGVGASAVILPVPFCLTDSHTNPVLWKVSLLVVALFTNSAVVFFSSKSRNESRGLRSPFCFLPFGLWLQATHFRGNGKPAEGTW